MVDLHCHILYDIDDGAKNLESSIQLCKNAQNNGIKHIVATPHTNSIENINNYLRIRDEHLSVLREEIKQRGINVSLYPGAEVYVDDDIFYASDLKRLTINESRYILVEFAFRNVRIKRLFEYLNEIVGMGLIPIIAHPERYEYLQYDYEAVNALASNGVIFQINAPSLASFDGPQEFELAYSMAYNGIASVIATDAHSMEFRPNSLMQMMERFPPDISQFNMQMMVHDAPKCILNDQAIPVVERGEIFKRGF